KTHNASGHGPLHVAWPISENTRICNRTWLTILNTAPQGNAWYILAQQWIGARLNQAAGASSTADITAALAASESLLASSCNTCSISHINLSRATDLARLL